ncbi:MAG: efflux RND transporter permease subunit [Calditrichaeota bacterium]|nr:efflux RND transporter permease subunit [Calditrichota bacterium]
MFDRLIRLSLEQRLVVLLATILVLLAGLLVMRQLPVDVFPDLNAPQVTILADAHGMAPEEIETLVSFPIETAMNGATGVRRVRSSIAPGMASIWVEFDWGTEIFKARQIVAEKLQSVVGQLPPSLDPPVLAPVSSIMGEILLVGVRSDSLSPMELRAFTDNVLRRRLLAIPGIANVLPIGGERKQYQVEVDPDRLAAYGISLDELVSAVEKSSQNSTGGFFVAAGQEYLIRGVGRVRDVDELRRAVVATKNGQPILVEQVADVQTGPAQVLGTASVNAKPAVILSVQKQPNANTLELTERIDQALDEMAPLFPSDVKANASVFRQADFIKLAVDNVIDALRDGAVLVTIILFLFLGHIRTTVISLTAIPLSLLVTLLVMRALGLSINTMTLGGMAIAVGVLVDDAIVYVENVYRRLRENRLKAPESQRQIFNVIFDASREIRQPMVIATIIIIAVFLPLFFLSGLEGRLLRPLGFAFVISVFASLLVAVTIVPALSYWLLPSLKSHKVEQEPWLVRKLKKVYEPALRFSLDKSRYVLAGSAILLVVAGVVYTGLGHSFLPEFNEGSMLVVVTTPPGTSLKESTDYGRFAEKYLAAHPAVVGVIRRTGRGELDEHTFGSNVTELEARLTSDANKEEVFKEVREQLSVMPGVIVSVGQPLTHRIDHMLSGTQAAIAIKLFGDNLYELRRIAQEIKGAISGVDGLVDLYVETQVDIPQLRVEMDREAMAMYGVQVEDLAHDLETAFNGAVVGQVLEGQFPYDLTVRFGESARDNADAIGAALFATPVGHQVPLRELTRIERSTGPNTISRENVSRKIVIQANASGRDVGSVIADVKAKINERVELPNGYFVTYGGQFESAQSANRMILLLSLLSIGAIIVLLYTEFKSFRDALLVMVNLPLALIGGVIAIQITDGIVSVASLVGFITLFGIAARNGILLIAHYHDLIDHEGLSAREAIIRGSMERMNPILMTALSAGLALLPLALGGGQPGKEIQTPMAIVILGGLLTSTALNMVVIPALYLNYGNKSRVAGEGRAEAGTR